MRRNPPEELKKGPLYRYFSRLFLLFVIYFISAQLGLNIDSVNRYATFIWPPAGISIAILYLCDFSLWPAITIGAFLVNLHLGAPIPGVLAIAIGNTLEALSGAYFLRRFKVLPALERTSDIAKLIIIAAIAGCISSSIGATSLWVAGLLGNDSAYRETFSTWWLGNLVGILTIAPLLLTWGAHLTSKHLFKTLQAKSSVTPRNTVQLPLKKMTETFALIGLTVMICGSIFQKKSFLSFLKMDHPYLIFPLSIWTALRFGPAASASVTFLVSTLAIWGTVNGGGPFITVSLSESLMNLQIFMSMLTLTSLFLSASVAERKQAKQALKASHDEMEKRVKERTFELERNRKLLSEAERLAHLGCWEWDIPSNTIEWSEELHRIYGLEPSQFDGTFETFLNLVYPEDRDAVSIAVKRALENRKDFSIRERIVRPDKSIRILHSFGKIIQNSSGDPVRIYGACQDITEYRLLWCEYEKSEMRFRAMVEGVKDYAVSLLDAQGHIESWNAGARNITGYQDSEVVGKFFSILYPREDVEQGKPMSNLQVSKEQGRCEDEGWRLRKEGTYFWAHVIITAIRNTNGVLLGFSTVTQDRTQWRNSDLRVKELLVREREARVQAEKAARVRDDLIAIVSHDLKNPLTGILAGANLIRRLKWVTDERAKRQLELIELSANRMNQLIRDLLDSYKSEVGGYKVKVEQDHESCEILPLVRSATELQLLIANEKKIRIEIQIPSGLPPVVVNTGLIGQVFQNLLGNSIKFTPTGGLVQIKGELIKSEIVFSIKDTGPGIEADMIPKIFVRFAQAKNTAQLGTGLGLVIAKGIVEAHGGRIWVESKLGLGTTFFFSIPLNHMKAMKAA